MVEQNITKIFTASPKDILKKLRPALEYNVAKCEVVLGEGVFGSVSRPNYAAFASVGVKNGKNVLIKTVLKKLKLPDVTNFGQTIISQDAINEHIDKNVPANMKTFVQNQKFPKEIYGFFSDDHDPHGEYIILAFVSKLWYNEITPHVPFLVIPMSCGPANRLDAFLLEANGLPFQTKTIFKTAPLYLQNPATHNFSYCETFYKLIEYMINMGEGNSCVLPNKETVHIPTFLDHMAISYLFTYQQLVQTIGLVLQDQHLNNVFMYWLDDKSYMGSQFIGQIKHIVYDLDASTQLLIDVPGVLLKIGDIGASILKPRKDVVVIGETFGSPDALLKALYADKMPYYMQFLDNLMHTIPFNILMQTCLFALYQAAPFNTLAGSSGITNDYPSCSDILKKYFKKYIIAKDVEDALHVKL